MTYLPRSEFLDQSLPEAAIAGLSDETIDEALIWASGEIDGYIAKAHTLPLVSWGSDLKALTGDLAQYRLLARRGFRPNSGNDQIAIKRYDDAISKLEKIAKGLVVLANVVDSTPDLDEDGPLISSAASSSKPFTFNTGRRGGCCAGD